MRRTRKQLEKEGWLRQFVADEAQAKDAVEIYDLLGYEVHLQPPNRRHFKKSISSEETSQVQYQIVYIRPKKSTEDEEVGRSRERKNSAKRNDNRRED